MPLREKDNVSSHSYDRRSRDREEHSPPVLKFETRNLESSKGYGNINKMSQEDLN